MCIIIDKMLKKTKQKKTNNHKRNPLTITNIINFNV